MASDVLFDRCPQPLLDIVRDSSPHKGNLTLAIDLVPDREPIICRKWAVLGSNPGELPVECTAEIELLDFAAQEMAPRRRPHAAPARLARKYSLSDCGIDCQGSPAIHKRCRPRPEEFEVGHGKFLEKNAPPIER